MRIEFFTANLRGVLFPKVGEKAQRPARAPRSGETPGRWPQLRHVIVCGIDAPCQGLVRPSSEWSTGGGVTHVANALIAA